MKFDAALRDEYRVMYARCSIIDGNLPNSERTWKDEIEDTITTILKGGKRYAEVSEVVHVPWFVIGILHAREASCRFTRHLHNGDPLASRTKNAPAGRPAGPWPIPGVSADELWKLSAIDALRYQEFDSWTNWTPEGCLYCFERWNGWGYRIHRHVSSYLWSGSNHCMSGKYVSDGRYDPNAVDTQPGAAVLLRRMADEFVIEFPKA